MEAGLEQGAAICGLASVCRGMLLLLLTLLLPVTLHAQQLTVFAAASLTDAMKDVSAAWEKQGHPALRMSFGASSTLARQIEQGAPVNLFASADERWMDYLANAIAPDTRRDLLSNQLVLIVPKSHPLKVTIGPDLDLNTLLGPDGRIATGDPTLVPVGLYAIQALVELGLWDKVRARLAPTEDVRDALHLVERGEVPAGIVYSTDAAVSPGVVVAGIFPESSHTPIIYPFAVIRAGDTPDARALLAYLAGPEGREIFHRRGFIVLE